MLILLMRKQFISGVINDDVRLVNRFNSKKGSCGENV